MRISKYLPILGMSLLLAVSCRESSITRIGIVPLGQVPGREITQMQEAISNTYTAEVMIMPERALPDFAFINVKTPRYRADKLIRWLKKTRPDSIDYLIGITVVDISTTKKVNGRVKEPGSKYSDWGIFGLGYRPGPSCIVSTYRLKSGASKAVFTDRLRKVSVHELGHCMGLPHCPDPSCVMTDALERIRTVDQANISLCPVCRDEL